MAMTVWIRWTWMYLNTNINYCMLIIQNINDRCHLGIDYILMLNIIKYNYPCPVRLHNHHDVQNKITYYKCA